jgi:16S rRNA (cytidine1402-2'-O)-methyltransferase
MPTLYVVSTPIGNLEDISLRALRILREVSLIAAEDTRTARRLLTAHGIKTKLVSYHEQGAKTRLNTILKQLTEGDVALVSEAGTPGLSDPGYDLVRAAAERGVQVVAIPGPSAITAALAVSGLPNDQFVYLGFLPRGKAERRKLLQNVAGERRTIVAFEAPHRLRASLADVVDALGDRDIAICREMTKLHEEVFRGSVKGALSHFTEPKGEFTLVIRGQAGASRATAVNDEVRMELKRLREQGLGAREAITLVSAATGLSRRALYKAWLD